MRGPPALMDAMAAYDAFCIAVDAAQPAEGHGDWWGGYETVDALSSSALEAFTSTHGLDLPADVRHFLTGLRRQIRIEVSDPQDNTRCGYGGFEWCGPSDWETMLPWFRKLADVEGATPLWRALHARGLPLTYHEPMATLNLDDGAVYWVLYDGDLPERPICEDFTAFFTAYVASGCFASHHFRPYWERVHPFVPDWRDPASNPWLTFYRGTYPDAAF